MNKYKTKPKEVDAIQCRGWANMHEIERFVNGAADIKKTNGIFGHELIVVGESCSMINGDYLIRDGGKFYSETEEGFHKQYEKVD